MEEHLHLLERVQAGIRAYGSCLSATAGDFDLRAVDGLEDET